MADSLHIPILSDLDIVMARVEGRNMARDLGFGVIDQARIATAISELTRNIVLYAGTGAITLRPIETPQRRGLEIVCADTGPGITDVNLVMREGYSSRRGLGMGLPGTRRLMDEFEIRSKSGEGTVITARKWLR
jgi:serine/threonine-protein kinase RsbT